MDTIFEKLLETIKEKMSKKQVIAIVAMLTLAVMKPTTKLELIVAGCITLIAIVGISWQGFLDKGDKNENSNHSNVPAD